MSLRLLLQDGRFRLRVGSVVWHPYVGDTRWGLQRIVVTEVSRSMAFCGGFVLPGWHRNHTIYGNEGNARVAYLRLLREAAALSCKRTEDLGREIERVEHDRY